MTVPQLLGPKRRDQIELVSADGGAWIALADYRPNAQWCMDPFHVVSWATDAWDELRRLPHAKVNAQPLFARDPSRPPTRRPTGSGDDHA